MPDSAAPVGPPFFTVITHQEGSQPELTGLCAGYEFGQWRCHALVDHLMTWLPDFCLNHTEQKLLNHMNAVEAIRKAAKTVYTTQKFKNRGEFGELLLHGILRHVYGTLPAISKMFYKDSSNDTVKGFDAVHVIPTDEGLELWLGEVKFHKYIGKAITEAVAGLKKYTDADYLRNEFIFIQNKIDDNWPHAIKLKRLLHENTSLNEVFDCVCIPVLLTYDSGTLANHTGLCDAYRTEIQSEFEKHHATFAGKSLPSNVKIHLFLLPLNTKAALIAALDDKLKTWQKI